jgi:transaldolase/transaldolase/glucose-6-phosphate isomerase
LLGSDTVNTMPEETIMAYQDHGEPVARLQDDLGEAHAVFEQLAEAGVDYEDLTDTLEREGVEKFSAAFDELMQTLRAKRDSLAPA